MCHKYCGLYFLGEKRKKTESNLLVLVKLQLLLSLFYPDASMFVLYSILRKKTVFSPTTFLSKSVNVLLFLFVCGKKIFLAENSEILIFAIYLVWKVQTNFLKKGMY